MKMDWTNPESIDTAFYTMKGLEDLARSIPEASRSKLLSSLAQHFSIPEPPNTEDQSVKRIFVFSRMKLDTLPDQEESRAFFSRSVSEAMTSLALTASAPVRPQPMTQRAEVAQPDAAERRPIEAEVPKPVQRSAVPAASAPVRHPPVQPVVTEITPRPIASQAKMPLEQKVDVSLKSAPVKPSVPPSAAASNVTMFRPPADRPTAWISGREPDGKPIDLPSGFTSMLLPHPKVDNLRDMSNWISGKPWSARSVVISFPQSPANVDRFVEEESEMSQGMALYLKRMGCMEIAQPSAIYKEWNPVGHADWLLAKGDEEIRVDALNYFAWAIGDALAVFTDGRIRTLHEHGASMTFGREAAQMITNLGNMEAGFLSEYDPEMEEHLADANILGSVNPRARIAPGISLRRAAFMHVARGADIGDCCVEALAELRLAQVQRQLMARYGEETANEAILAFNAIFFTDCQSDADAYRIAKNEVSLDHS